ncbi:MAG: hypothetical protein WKF84_02165 [Pyrinomonadaceae bacterium]
MADGIERFRAAIEAAPTQMSEKLFAGVVAKIPTNLFLRAQAAAASDAARAIEAKVNSDAKRLLALATFYLSVEQSDEATRVASQAIALAPEMAAARQSLGAAHLSV